jgi:hypothetical protein
MKFTPFAQHIVTTYTPPPPQLHLTKAQKGVYFSGIKVYKSLSQSIKQLSTMQKNLKLH